MTAILFSTGCDPQKPVTSPAGRQPQATAPALAPAATPAIAPTAAPQSDRPDALSAQAPAPAPANPHKDQQLIESVEQAYQAGIGNYRAGHVQAAKANFDYAVDLMLTSGRDLKNDAQLSDEFERIVDAVNTLEMDALKQGNGFAPRTEPAPVDVANDVTFTVDPNVKAQAQAELKTTQSDLPLVLNDYVAGYINFFANSSRGHNTIVHSLTRSGRYRDMIRRVLAQEGVPQDLIYQAVAESGFQTQAMNGRTRAGGMWQFMPGDTFAPARSAWYDQRFDPEKATHAYARYMKFLYNQLGDWYLAMAAYDWGAGNVQRAVQRTGYADFWELYRRNALPAETKNYVPIILAAAIMAKNPKQYGLDNIAFDPPLLTDTVTTNYSVDLRLVSDVVELPLPEIVGLNPSLLRMSTPPDESFDLHLPPGTGDLYRKRIAEIPEDRRRTWRFHKVTAGETIESIARTYRVSPTEIAFVNQLDGAADISGADALVIPVTAAAASPSRSTHYTVRRGDTLVTVADRFNVSVEDLRSWNHLKNSSVTPGRKLYVSEPAHVSSGRGRRRSSGTQRAAYRSRKTSRVRAASHSSMHAAIKSSASAGTLRACS